MPESVLLWGGVAGCALATLAEGARARRDGLLPTLLLVSASAFAAVIALRWIRIGHGPFLSLFEVLLSNLFSLALLYAIAWWLSPAIRAGATVASGFVLLLGVWCATVPAAVTRLPASYDNPWLWAHVVSGKLFLGAALVAFGVAVLRLCRPGSRGLPVDDIVEWRWMGVAFVCQSVMLIAGAAWARDAWGRFWAWDPLETWAFVTWLLLGAALHARLAWRLPTKVGAVAITLVFVLAVLTFLGVPLLSESVHKGVM